VTISGTGFPAATRLTVYLADGDPAGDPKAGRYSYVTTSSDGAGDYRLTLNIPDAWPDGTPLDARPLAIVVVAEDLGLRAHTSFALGPSAPAATAPPADTPVPTFTATSVPADTAVPTFTATPVPTGPVEGAAPSPPQAQAALVPLTCANNGGEFQVVATADDPNGNLQAVVALIRLPWRQGEQRVQLKVGPQTQIKLTPNKLEIKAPDPERLLAQLQRDGGILVENGQVVMARRKAAAQQEFKLEDGVWQIAAPALELQVSAADADGLTRTATATANLTCAEAAANQAGDKENGKGEGKGKSEDRGKGNDQGKGKDKGKGNDEG
jgi:hypothetical protein